MRRVTTVGIDLAKAVFQVHGADKSGKKVFSKKLSRKKLPEFIASLPACLIGMEACSGAHFWAAKFIGFGHKVKLMPAQYVKPYVKTNKNDMADAEAICEAVTRPGMRFVPIKNNEQLDIQALHRMRARLIGNRTRLCNQIRGLLHELGFVFPKGIRKVREALPALYSDPDSRLNLIEREYLSGAYDELISLDENIGRYEELINGLSAQSEAIKRVRSIPGMGPIGASAIVAAAGDAREFKNGRQFSAWLGLVPRQNSSGGKDKLLGISKRGDVYLRCLLIHGARAVLTHCSKKSDKTSKWLQSLIERRGFNKAAVAYANKMARMVWVVLAKEEEFQKA